MPQPHAAIDLNRLKSLLAGVNRFGFNRRTGGYDRLGFSDADMACRDWFEQQMRSDGLTVWRDGAANIFGRFGLDSGPAILIGSHLDTVANGGAFDGALGVCVALECVRRLKETGFSPATAIEVIATSEEEGRFGGMLGSQAITGQLSADWLEAAVDAGGTRLVDAMADQGLEPQQLPAGARDPGSVMAFLELHIEQGPVLEAKKIAVGIATTISGVCYLEMTLAGTANHSGTTPMSLRADAFAGLAELATRIPEIIRIAGGAESRITIGHVALTPNQPHTIPGKAVFSVILRDTSEATLQALRSEFEQEAARVAQRHGLTLMHTQRSWLAPVSLDAGLADQLEHIADEMRLKTLRLPSGAGHDAQTMQAFCPSALIFVPSRHGISHAPEEYSDWADIERGANLMLNLLMELAREKSR
ncbi:Zn-dependent hydrolase [Radicibacter daui]|uniref:Zn-dependent hydrolase n=1 Tax=Radicibacter daui TaxID=3064829 RepID=UPI00404688F1